MDGLYWLDGKYNSNGDSRSWQLNIRNTYANYETSLTYKTLIEKNPNKRPMVLSRAGWPGIQRYAMNWSGDNSASWDHCRHNIRLGLSTMISGQVNFGHDVGGFIGDSSGELMTRWTQWAAFTPLLRNHSQYSDREREPWRYNQPYAENMIAAIKFRYKMMPYFYSLIHQSTVTGIPMNSPTVMHFTDDIDAHTYNDYDFMVGDYMLVSPVYEDKANERYTYLPKGVKWFNWHNDNKFDGGNWVKVNAPIEILPIFVREGAIIPMGPIASSMKDLAKNKPTWLDINIWPAEHSFFELYEDDGISQEYLNGNFAKTRMEASLNGSSFTFKIADKRGYYETGREVYILKVHNITHENEVSVNGRLLTKYNLEKDLYDNQQGFSYNKNKKLLIIKVRDTKREINISAVKDLSITPTEDNWKRTIVLMQKETLRGQKMFIRGGINHDYGNANGRNCRENNFECAIPIKHLNLYNNSTYPLKSGDDYLDWSGTENDQNSAAFGTPLDWTTNNWPEDWGNAPYYDNSGYGLTDINSYGMHYWIMETIMDCSKTENGWFELKAIISNSTDNIDWEGDINQSQTPYTSNNHFALCGKLNVFKMNQNEPVDITDVD